jgi:hypothetical protein
MRLQIRPPTEVRLLAASARWHRLYLKGWRWTMLRRGRSRDKGAGVTSGADCLSSWRLETATNRHGCDRDAQEQSEPCEGWGALTGWSCSLPWDGWGGWNGRGPPTSAASARHPGADSTTPRSLCRGGIGRSGEKLSCELADASERGIVGAAFAATGTPAHSPPPGSEKVRDRACKAAEMSEVRSSPGEMRRCRVTVTSF